jgi:hypothetical protein
MVGENAGIVSFIVAVAVVFRLRHRPFALTLVLLACSVPGFIGWLLLAPRDDRRWQSDMAETPWAEISADHVTLHNFRNTARLAADNYSPRWETRRFSLSALRHLDYFIVYWDSPHIGHTMMTFDFGPEGRVCASIEARREQGEIYAPLAGAFRQYELLYVLGDERDTSSASTSRPRPSAPSFWTTFAPATLSAPAPPGITASRRIAAPACADTWLQGASMRAGTGASSPTAISTNASTNKVCSIARCRSKS